MRFFKEKSENRKALAALQYRHNKLKSSEDTDSNTGRPLI